MIKKKDNIFLTFDYEMFLGDYTGSIEKCLLEPTSILINILKGKNALFFIDTTFLLFLKKHNKTKYKLVENQIIQLLENGFDIGLHLHPQWIDAYEFGNGWKFKTFKHFKLHSLSKRELNNLFNDSIKLLTDIGMLVKQNFKVNSFRAGGWCLEPFEYIESLFSEYNIILDSSVLPQMYFNDMEYNNYDYRSITYKKSFYKFKNMPLFEDTNGKYLEIPITVYRSNFLLNILIYILKDKSFWGDGIGIKIKNNKIKTLKKIFNRDYKMFTLDALSVNIVKNLISYVYENLLFTTWVGHPKMLNKNNINGLKYLVVKYNTISENDIIKLQEQ